ncbi:MAG: hypothetical protein D3919_03525 [Candidatus Electrothrix sp. AW5]|nr:hypothetical protein [Candidatus Electrothrix gigas]
MKQQPLFTAALLLGLGISCTAQAAPTLSLSSSSAEPGSSTTLQLSISGVETSYSGFNAELKYPACMSVSSVEAGTLLDSSFLMDSVETTGTEGNTLSFLAYSGTGSFSADGVLLSLIFEVGADCPTGQHTVSFASVNPEPLVNSRHALANQDGSVSVSHQVSNGSIVLATDNDTDQDGMEDDWERFYFGNLSHDGSADSDQDGYTDLQEYLNFSNGEQDPEGNAFDPTRVNVPGGTGYQEVKKGNFWLLVLPAIQSGASAGR